MNKITHDRKLRRVRRVRAGITGTHEIPRISVFRSNKYIYVQAIDDVKKVTLVASSTFSLDKKENIATKTAQAFLVGKQLAQKLATKKISKGVFDRGGHAYLGRVKALAEGLREGGLKI